MYQQVTTSEEENREGGSAPLPLPQPYHNHTITIQSRFAALSALANYCPTNSMVALIVIPAKNLRALHLHSNDTSTPVNSQSSSTNGNGNGESEEKSYPHYDFDDIMKNR